MRLAAQYGALLIVDPEEEFYAAEVAKLATDVAEQGLGLIVFAEWYNTDVMTKMRFFDDNTRSWWTPITGVPTQPVDISPTVHFFDIGLCMPSAGARPADCRCRSHGPD